MRGYNAAKAQLEMQLSSAGKLTDPQSVVDQYWTKISTAALANNLIDVSALTDLTAGNNFMAPRQAALNKARQQVASGFTLEYDYSQQANQPRLSMARLIYTLHPGILSTDTSQSKTPAAGTPASAAKAAPKQCVRHIIGRPVGHGFPAAPATHPTNAEHVV
jgi:hypothetical protein